MRHLRIYTPRGCVQILEHLWMQHAVIVAGIEGYVVCNIVLRFTSIWFCAINDQISVAISVSFDSCLPAWSRTPPYLLCLKESKLNLPDRSFAKCFWTESSPRFFEGLCLISQLQRPAQASSVRCHWSLFTYPLGNASVSRVTHSSADKTNWAAMVAKNLSLPTPFCEARRLSFLTCLILYIGILINCTDEFEKENIVYLLQIPVWLFASVDQIEIE